MSRTFITPRRARRRSARGFTLVELCVASAAGLAVAAVAFLLSRNAASTFQHEARLTSASLGATLGMHRLAADLGRAGFLSSANVHDDPAICGAKGAWPEGLRRLAGIFIQRQGSLVEHPGDLDQSLANGFLPDALVIGGAFGSNEQFPIRFIRQGIGGGHEVHLQVAGSGAMRRALSGGARLADVFRAGRFLRIVMPGQTHAMYGVIAGLDVIGDPPLDVVVHLAPQPALPLRGDGPCGVGLGANVGGMANPVSRVRYDLRRLRGHPRYDALVSPMAPEVTGDDGRTELVRVELDAQGQEIDETLELVAEYAVDLKFGISAADPGVTRYPIAVPDDTNIYTIAGDINDGGSPERVRSVMVRLATRTRAPDRTADLPKGADGRKHRFLIPGLVPGVTVDTDTPPPGAPPVFARLRTLHADIALPNIKGATIW